MVAPVIYTVDGTAYPGAPNPNPPPDCGQFASQIAYDLARSAHPYMWSWTSIGYPAATIPMGPSRDTGIANLKAALTNAPAGPFVLAGYSQGAMVTGTLFANEILPTNGDLHSYFANCVAVINFGDPLRCPGVANGNPIVGLTLPPKVDGQTTGGIAGYGDLRLDETPTNYLSIVLPGDLYADCPVGDNPWYSEACTGWVETGIYNIVVDGFNLSDIGQIAQDLMYPQNAIEAITNGWNFLTAGANAPHYQYGPYVQPIADYLITLGGSL